MRFSPRYCVLQTQFAHLRYTPSFQLNIVKQRGRSTNTTLRGFSSTHKVSKTEAGGVNIFHSMTKPKDEKPEGKGSRANYDPPAGDTTHRDIDEWKFREPYRIHEKDEKFDGKWNGSCHCGKVQFQLKGDPLAAKYCHCHTCQKLHSVSLAANLRYGIYPAKY